MRARRFEMKDFNLSLENPRAKSQKIWQRPKKTGSSRINVKMAEFCEYSEFEVGEISVSESDAYCCS